MKIARFRDSFLSLKIHFYFIRKVPLRVISQLSHQYKLEDEEMLKNYVIKEMSQMILLYKWDRIGQIGLRKGWVNPQKNVT